MSERQLGTCRHSNVLHAKDHHCAEFKPSAAPTPVEPVEPCPKCGIGWSKSHSKECPECVPAAPTPQEREWKQILVNSQCMRCASWKDVRQAYSNGEYGSEALCAECRAAQPVEASQQIPDDLRKAYRDATDGLANGINWTDACTCALIERIGRAEAERDWAHKLVREYNDVLKTRTDELSRARLALTGIESCSTGNAETMRALARAALAKPAKEEKP